MAIWTMLLTGAAGFAGAGLAAAVDRAVSAIRSGAEHRRQVAFTIAAIALAAKMARADGHASDREFLAFQRLFHVPDQERGNMYRFYDLARQSTHGHRAYAKQAAQLLGPGSPVLEDLLEALLMIATVDGVHPAEIDFLEEIAPVMGFDSRQWAAIKARHIPLAPDDPHAVLGITPEATLEEIRAAWRRLARDHHPDRHIAEGTPPEFIRIAETRMAAINDAYRRLSRGAA